MNESFSFASFFPEPIEAPIKTFSTIIFNLLVIAHICKPRPVASTQPSSPLSEPITIEAERRRQRALQMLDQRMQQMKQYGNADVSTPKNDGIQEV